MLFADLLAAAGVHPKSCRGDAAVTGVQVDSRRCVAGSCFVAVKGCNQDGHAYIPAAIKNGAVAVICQDPQLVPPAMCCAVIDDARAALGPLAQAFHGWPSRRLTSIGVTGTKGKSTITYLARALLEDAGFCPALLGTISYETGRRTIAAPNTTPDAVLLAEMMAEMVAAGMTHLVMETSSHSLDQGRTGGVDFRVGVFTNLSGDHMDYHPTVEHYFAAKRRLFEGLSRDAAAVVNWDDPHGRQLKDATRARLIRFGLGDGADLRAEIRRIDFRGTQFDLHWHGGRHLVHTPLMGKHNVYNCLAAIGAALGLGLDLERAAAAVGKVSRIPGRLERVPVDAPYQVFVDYAHTDDALANLLAAIAAVKKDGRVIVLFGCGGDRDRTKRPRMAAVAEKMADHVIITSDNPRTEDPQAIIDEVVTGLSSDGRRRADIVPDRKTAIELAIAKAKAGDIVLLAGKGHEDYQIIGTEKIHFDDREIAALAMARREGRS